MDEANGEKIRIRHKWQNYKDTVDYEMPWCFVKVYVHHKGTPNEYEIPVEYEKSEWRRDT